MDDAVLHALGKWPHVPHCYGWLALTRRGEWRIGETRERIAHAGLIEFINRNYVCDDRGAWFFQNGPQRVYVALEYTPWVYRLRHAATPLCFETHTGVAVETIDGAWLDDGGVLLLHSEVGVGVVLDRDLSAVIEYIGDSDGVAPGCAPVATPQGSMAQGDILAWLDTAAGRVPLKHIRADAVAAAFRFQPAPRPA